VRTVGLSADGHGRARRHRIPGPPCAAGPGGLDQRFGHRSLDGYPLVGAVLEDRAAVLTASCDLAQARDKRLVGDNDLLADRRPELYP
jgi:hypothetical protein